ncbi:MAG: PEP-CTERM sorting domain-containing protein [Coleofasciculus sp. D1-CHI-01]|uniref:PEP-CTERM sorting domain-containing protein n=1 Tax=Coleofasciculus sp. D1-CHI-01 TaxID=3068482 RepID=UPI0032F19F56
MNMKHYHHFQTTIAASTSLALGFLLTEANPVQASIITYEFTVDITSGDLIRQSFTGSFSYDNESTPVGFGYGSEEFFLTEFEFYFDGLEYTLDDVACQYTDLCIQGTTPPFWVGGIFPQWGKDSLALRTKDAFGFEFGPSIFLASQSEFEYRNIGSGVGVFEGDVTYSLVSESTSVPDPTSTLGLLALGTLGTGSSLLRRRKQKTFHEGK